MTFEEIKEVIVDTISCDAADVVLEADLQEDLGADSLDAIELSMAMEDKFSITIDDSALQNFSTVGDIVNYLTKNK